MKNFLLSLLAILAIQISLNAQGFSSVTDAASIAREIIKVSGKRTNFLLKEGNVDNAMAIVSNGQRYVLYNPRFINRLTDLTGTRWAAVSVLAHEIGHHLYGTSYNGRTISLATELQADEFSGNILHRLGANLQESEIAMSMLASVQATRTHPGRADRLNAIETGWNQSYDQSDQFGETIAYVKAVSPGYEMQRQPVNENTYARQNTNIPARRVDQVLGKISFRSDPGTQYLVTSRSMIVKVEDNQAVTVGKISRLQDRRFPFVILDKANNRAFVNQAGYIFNENGLKIGILSFNE